MPSDLPWLANHLRPLFSSCLFRWFLGTGGVGPSGSKLIKDCGKASGVGSSWLGADDELTKNVCFFFPTIYFSHSQCGQTWINDIQL